MPPVAPEVRGVRVAGEVLVVPPFECAWLTSPSGARVAQAGGGEVSFEAAAQSDITCILEEEHVGPARRPTRRLDHWSGLAADDDRRVSSQTQSQTYVIIIGSHRNSRLCIERNGRVAHVARGEFIKPGAVTAFARYWISWTDDGLISVGIGGAGTRPRLVHRWRDPEPLRRVRCVGLSTWDDWTRFRNIEITSPPREHGDADVDAEGAAEGGEHARLLTRVAPAAAVAAANAARDDESRTNLSDLADVAVVRRRGCGDGECTRAARVAVSATSDREDFAAISARYAADGTRVVSRAHAAVLAAASPALRTRLEEAARRVGDPRRPGTKTAETADIAAALGGNDGSHRSAASGAAGGPAGGSANGACSERLLRFVVEVFQEERRGDDDDHDDDDSAEMVSVLDRFAGTDEAANERVLKTLFRNPGPGGVASRVAREFSDVVVAVRAGSVAEADEAVRAGGVPATVFLSTLERRFPGTDLRDDVRDATETETGTKTKTETFAVAEFHAHRVVLACFAPFFRDVFASGMREASEHVVRFGGSGGHPSDDDDDADAAAVAAFLRFAYAGSFPDSAPAAETLALCLRFRATAATEAVTRALADAAERDASDAARLLALAPAFGVDAFDEDGASPDGDVAADAVDADAVAATTRAAFDGPLLLTRLFSRCARSLARNVADADPDALAGVSADAFAATVGRDDLGVADEDEALALAQAWVSAKRRSPAETLTVAASVRWPQTSAAAARNARDAFRRASGGVTLLSPRLEALFAEAPTLSGAAEARADDLPGLDDATTEKDAVFFSSPASPTSSPLAVATDGASVSLSASKSAKSSFRDAARRRAPRERFGTLLTFLRAGDANGVFRHVGSRGGRSHFRNPASFGMFGDPRESARLGPNAGENADKSSIAQNSRIVVTASSPSCPHTNPAQVTSGAYARVNFAGPPRRSENASGASGAGPLGESFETRQRRYNGGWWRFDLGEARTLRCAHYSMRHDGTAHFPRHWELQGCASATPPRDDDDDEDKDDDAPRWITLRKHVDDRSISAPGAWASWAIDAPASSTPVRFLRLVLTGRDEHAPEDEHAGRFHLCSAEFYGLLACGGKLGGRA